MANDKVGWHGRAWPRGGGSVEEGREREERREKRKGKEREEKRKKNCSGENPEFITGWDFS